MHIGDILIGAAVLAVLLLALGAMNRKKENGCSGSCAGCSMAGSCHNEEKTE